MYLDDGIVDIRNHAYRGCIDQQITLCNGISQCSMIIIVEEADLAACFSREILSEFLCAIPVSAGAAGKNMYGSRTVQGRLCTDAIEAPPTPMTVIFYR